MELVFVGDGNHDIYVDDNQTTFWAMSKDGNPKGDSYFGNIHHIRRLMDFDKEHGRNFIDSHRPTEKARELFAGMAHHRVGAEGNEFWILRL